MTIDSPDIIREMLENGGAYPGDPPASLICECLSFDTSRHYAIFMLSEHDDIEKSRFIKSYTCLFANGIVTVDGQEWLKET